MARLLLVEDDTAISDPLARTLRREGHDVAVLASGAQAVAAAGGGDVDLVLLDLGLPDVDGLEVCRRIRERTPSLPILMLTARAEEIDKVVGLDAGADDYLAKPFGVAELLARVRALLRRGAGAPGGADADGVAEAGGVRVDEASRRAWAGDRELDLTPKEFDLLALLVRRAGTVVRREEIIELVWDPHWFGSTKTLDMHVSWLRRKLADEPASPRFITTVRGVGYRFERGS